MSTSTQGMIKKSNSKRGTKKTSTFHYPIVKLNTPDEPVSGHSEQSRNDLIAQAAYRLAEQRGFIPGRELDDWLTAEFEVDQRLMGNGFM